MGVGTVDNLLVGDINSSAFIKLTNGSTLTITGAENDKIELYVINGTAIYKGSIITGIVEILDENQNVTDVTTL